MREITITITEQDLLEATGRTVEEIANVNNYRAELPNPDHVPAVGREFMDDPEGTLEFDEETGIDRIKQIPNPDYVPAVGEPTIPNPVKPTQHIAEKLLEYGMKEMAEPIKRAQLKQVTKQTEELFDGSVKALVAKAQVNTVE